MSADPDEVLPDPTALLITLNKAAINSLRDDQQRKLRALAEAGPAAAARQQPAVGLVLCSKEWAGLELQHTGSWQLSLVYNDEQLRFFGQVCKGPCMQAVWALKPCALLRKMNMQQCTCVHTQHGLRHAILARRTTACPEWNSCWAVASPSPAHHALPLALAAAV